MGVFSYLSLKKPAALLWKAFSPSRDIIEDETTEPEKDEVEKEDSETDKAQNERKISEGSNTSSGVSDVSGSYLSDSLLSSSAEMSSSLGPCVVPRLEMIQGESGETGLNRSESSVVLLESPSNRNYLREDSQLRSKINESGRVEPYWRN